MSHGTRLDIYTKCQISGGQQHRALTPSNAKSRAYAKVSRIRPNGIPLIHATAPAAQRGQHVQHGQPFKRVQAVHRPRQPESDDRLPPAERTQAANHLQADPVETRPLSPKYTCWLALV
jgi:hypothetical protein